MRIDDKLLTNKICQQISFSFKYHFQSKLKLATLIAEIFADVL